MKSGKLMSIRILVFIFTLSFGLRTSAHCSDCIIVNLPSRTIELFKSNKVVKKFPIAIGKTSTPTPLGKFSVISKDVNPIWYPPGKEYYVLSGPDNPLGYRWIGFYGNYGIHGTNAPWSIGHAVSNGCIRMHEEDVEELFELVELDMAVNVTYDRVKVYETDQHVLYAKTYPDVYGYKDLEMNDIRQALHPYDLDSLISPSLMQQILSGENENIALAAKIDIYVNEQRIPAHGLRITNKTLVPIVAVAQVLKIPIEIDSLSAKAKINNQIIPAIIGTKHVYVQKEYLQTIFGGSYNYNNTTNTLTCSIPVLYFNNKPIAGKIYFEQDKISISSIDLLKELEKSPYKDSAQIKHLEDLMKKSNFIDLNTFDFYQKYKGFVYCSPNKIRIEISLPLNTATRND